MTEPAPDAGLSDEAALRIFRTMTTIRLTEDRIMRGLGAGEFRMTYYNVRGQEVIPAAIGEHLRRDDYMVTTYRGMHDCIAKGIPLDEMVAEMCGKVTGTSKGKGGPMHLSDPQSGVMVTTGVVGGGLPIAVGLALASQLRGTDQVTVVNFGDGATSIGATHEAANLAALWQVPLVFVCQNNRYGEHTAFADYTRTPSLAERFQGYGMAATTVDGNNVPDMFAAAAEAIGRARSGGGPTFLECMTYRLGGHTFGATTEYMDPDEFAAAEENEPVGKYRRWLIETRGIGEATLAGIEGEVATEVEAAVASAKAADPPPPDELQLDVFADPVSVPR
ncbi:MAG TPA: thiamine pyrophosphate-dependent dehydrogenase E1 component subunit alpha [Acidimicrobiales bacterium]|jgi:pyruvate dehydrogenase E1 component alpha subunit|nr:thiamine pyrophosphate-dependent dehydrogenase E1 component subunit alpha [Acidimicrobiales bacterium]